MSSWNLIISLLSHEKILSIFHFVSGNKKEIVDFEKCLSSFKISGANYPVHFILGDDEHDKMIKILQYFFFRDGEVLSRS